MELRGGSGAGPVRLRWAVGLRETLNGAEGGSGGSPVGLRWAVGLRGKHRGDISFPGPTAVCAWERDLGKPRGV